VYSSVFSGNNNLRLTYLSLGNADCTHFRTPDNSNILIDAGYENYYNHSNSYKVIPYLKRQGVRELDLFILTRPPGKNFRAIDNILKNFEVKRLVMPCTDNRVMTDGTEIICLNEITDIYGFGNIKIEFLRNNDNPGDGFAMKISYGNKSFLFPNLNDSQSEKVFAAEYGVLLDADVLKVQGYGSRKYTSADFLSIVTPEISVVSAAGIKDRNIPSKEVIANLRNIKSSIYRTDIDNAVILETDGNVIEKVSY
jgi:competence protein ComEC